MPVVNSPTGLERIVVGIGGGFFIVVIDFAAGENPRSAAALEVIVVGLNHRQGGLVQIAEAKQFVTLGAHIAHLQGVPAPKLLLRTFRL